MGDAVLRALESEGIVLDTSVDAVAPVGFSFLGECKSTPGVSRKSLSVWHAPYTHLPLTTQDAERLVIHSSNHSMSLLASERPVPPAVRELLEGNGYEVWDREEVIRILGKAQLSSGNPPEEAEDDDENALPPLDSDSVLSHRMELRTILETLRIEGITRPILLEVRGLGGLCHVGCRSRGKNGRICDRNRESVDRAVPQHGRTGEAQHPHGKNGVGWRVERRRQHEERDHH